MGRLDALGNPFLSFFFCFFAQVPSLVAMLGMSVDKKQEACQNLESFESQLGPLGLMQLMKCSADFTSARANAIEFCGAAVSEEACLPSTPLVFQDQHDGDRKLVTLTGNQLSITLFDRLLTIWMLPFL